MNILIISSLNDNTGSGFAAKKIYNALKSNNNITVTYLTFNIYKNLSSFSRLNYFFAKVYFYIVNLMCNFSSHELFTPFIFNPFIRFDLNSFDLINVHWTGFGFLPKSLKYTSKPIVITHHDNWWFSGGCHYFYDCLNYELKCRSCPKNKNRNFNISYEKKRSYLKSSNVSNIFVSEEQKSKLNLPGDVIGNIIPCNNLSEKKFSKKYDYLFVASNFNTDKRKGIELLHKFLNFLDNSHNVLIVGDRFIHLDNYSCSITNLLFASRTDLFQFYRHSSIVLILSFDETFGQVAGESISCGSIPVGFVNTGLSDIVNSDPELLSTIPNLYQLFAKTKPLLLNSTIYDEKLNILKNHIRNKYSERIISDLYFKVFEEAIL